MDLHFRVHSTRITSPGSAPAIFSPTGNFRIESSVKWPGGTTFLTAATASLYGIAIAAQTALVPSGAVTSTRGVNMRAMVLDSVSPK